MYIKGIAMKKVTIKEVANKAGVSVTTASFAINGVNSRVSDATRDKVLSVASQLGYVKDYNACALRLKQSNTILLVYSEYYLEEPNASTTQFITEIIKYAQRNDKTVIINTTAKFADSEKAIQEFVSAYKSGQVEGIIFIPAFEENYDEIFERLYNEYSVNIAVISPDGEPKKFPACYSDYYFYTTECMNLIVNKGYKEIYYVSMQYFDKKPSRMIAYEDYIKSSGIKGKTLTYENIYRSKYELWNIVEPIIKNQCSDIAFVCWNDVDAINLLDLLNIKSHNKNYRIGVIGFDDMHISASTIPPLTTVHYSFKNVAKAALSILDKAELDKKNPPNIDVPCRIVERESL